MQREHTTLTLQNENGTYTVTVHEVELHLGLLIEELVEPVLRAAGYSEKSISRCLRGEDK